MHTKGIVAAAVAMVVTLVNSPVTAQTISLEVEHGLVTLDASQASAREILERWAQLRGLEIVNVERVSNVPMSAMQLARVPERAALATLLRDTYGYVILPRQDSPGTIGRIMIAAPIAPAVVSTAGMRPQTALTADQADAGVRDGVGLRQPPVTAASSAFMSGTDGPAGPDQDRADGVPFVAPVPRTPGLTEMPLGTAVQPAPPQSPVPPNPFGITSGATRFGATAPAAPPVPPTPAADGSVTYRSGGDILPEEPRR